MLKGAVQDRLGNPMAGEDKEPRCLASLGDLDGDRSINSDAEIAADVLDVVVEALVDALVLDYQQDVDAMVNSPRGKDHDCYRCVP